MSEDRKSKPLTKITGMYENQSKRTGDWYFNGLLGLVKVLMLREKNPEPGKPTWGLYIQEKDPKPDQAQGSTGGYGQQTPAQQQGHSQARQPTQPPAQQQYSQSQPGGEQFQDDIPF